jgi:hypothetical protein
VTWRRSRFTPEQRSRGTIIGAVIGYESGRPSANCSEFLDCADFSEVGANIGGVIGVVIVAFVGVCSVIGISVTRRARRRNTNPPERKGSPRRT